MRPKSKRHARRAAAAGVLALGAVAATTAAPQTSTAQPALTRAAARSTTAKPQLASARLTLAGAAAPLADSLWSLAADRRRPPVPRLSARLLHANVLIGGDVAVIGQASPRPGHRAILVEEFRTGRWLAVARTITDRLGHFSGRFWPRQLGTVLLRVRAAGVPVSRTRLRGRFATVFHRVVASWYGPGGVTACGESLGVATLGVANRTLPCGTMVTLRLGDRSVRVPVIDRGPYVYGRDYDLTYATKLALGAGDVTSIWASA
jgi:rare lipoprotein A